MSEQLYVFETTFPNGTVIAGKAGLPYKYMVDQKQYYTFEYTTRIVPAPANTPRLKILSHPKHTNNLNV